ncbi:MULTISPECIES: hypothetical protein [Enterococcus]|uniref:hypothetical protein n=1 Tax=Enterococcus TaxID=1350 RepID=UPI0026EB17B7|nr:MULTISPECIES: hypothetical protein [Enterococcus]MDT2739326.1 hypothetical protein [Enterococcus canintestini]
MLKKWLTHYRKFNQQQKKLLWFWLLGLSIVFIGYIGYTTFYLYSDKQSENKYWTQYLHEKEQLTTSQQKQAKDAISVSTGVYVENINEISIRNSNFNVTFQVWFKWDDHHDLNMLEHYEIYNGQIKSQEILKESRVGKTNYQLARVNAVVTKTFWTTRFPLGSYQIRFYLEPKSPIENIVLQADRKNSSINENINISGFSVKRFDTNLFVQEYQNNKADPEANGNYTVTEFLTAIELNRENIGLYIKCFIALVGTLGWVLIVLFICTYHNVDPLGMIPSALFGTVSNILVGANLVPDALHTGLLEFVNIFGIIVILFSSLAVITINRQRSYYHDDDFAAFFGRHIFWMVAIFTVAGNILLPMAAYNF